MLCQQIFEQLFPQGQLNGKVVKAIEQSCESGTVEARGRKKGALLSGVFFPPSMFVSLFFLYFFECEYTDVYSQFFDCSLK